MLRRIVIVAVVLVGLSVLVFVARDGSPLWLLLRVVAVVALTGLTVASLLQSDDLDGRLAWPVGLVSLVAGIGFAPWIVKQPGSLTGLASLVAIVAGLVLLVIGTGLAMRDRTRTAQVAYPVLTLVVLVAGVWVVSPALLATNVPRTSLGDTPAQVGLDAEDVEITTSDGVALAGWYVPSTNGAAVVLRHGSGSTRSAVLGHAEVLVEAGYGVLMLDARGQGDSGGRAMGFGWWGERDIDAGLRFLAGRDDVEPTRLGVVGLSMGGEEGIGSASSSGLVRAVVAEGATGRTADDDGWYSEEFGVRGWLQEQLEAAQDVVLGVLTEAPRPVSLRESVQRSAGVPFLLVAAGTVADEGHVARYLQSAAPDRVDVWVVREAGHTDALDTARDEWVDRVVGFLDAALLDPAVDPAAEPAEEPDAAEPAEG